MDFVFATLILVIYYIRPQDWLPGMAGTNIVKPIVGLGIMAMATRPRGFDLSSLVRTPMDWVMYTYSAYVIFTAPDVVATFKAFIPFTVFYILVSQAIDSREKLTRYLKWWTIALLVISTFALGILYGIDITGGKEMTDFFKGRLSLGTYIHNNPNALGHSVVCAIPLTYYLLFWKSSVRNRILSVPLILIAGYCAYKTESKGAFLTGGGAVVLALILGRSRFVQVLALITAMILGGAVLTMLPRMDKMSNLRSDEGVQGRLLAWEMARTSIKNNSTGEGFKQFQAWIPWEGQLIPKATHGAYIRVGADLGYPGLFLYLAVLWCSMRALLIPAPPGDIESERVRRMLLILLATYIASGWMINRSYHTEYFLIAAATSAYHCLALNRRKNALKANNEDLSSSPNPTEPPVTAELALFVQNTDINNSVIDFSQPINKVENASTASLLPIWHRLTIIDLLGFLSITWLTLYFWDYVLKNI